MSNLNLIVEAYNAEVSELPTIHKEEGGGKARNGSGSIFEKFISRICLDNGLEAKKNDYKNSEEIDGYCLTNLQVDKHIYRDGVMVKAVESKTYLDSCYLKRAVLDFIELESSPDVPDNVDYAILTGQECVAENSLNYYLSLFKRKTNKTLNIFVVNQHKKRSADRAIYMEEYNENFQLDINEVNRFVEWLND